ncbi:MAG: hypothetical protein K0Q60_3501 [Microvirga sp.]|nr:hypothetical protein [Microvirga sp.]
MARRDHLRLAIVASPMKGDANAEISRAEGRQLLRAGYGYDYGLAHPCLVALGRPLSEQGVRDLVVDTRTLNNCSVARLSDFVKAADEYIGRRLARPNLKAAAAAKARAAKAGARQHEAA